MNGGSKVKAIARKKNLVGELAYCVSSICLKFVLVMAIANLVRVLGAHCKAGVISPLAQGGFKARGYTLLSIV